MANLDYLNQGNLDYIENLFQQYLKAPESIQTDWKFFFQGVELARHLSPALFSEKELAVFRLISTYRNDGHLKARLDPLHQKNSFTNHASKLFELKNFGLSKADLEKTFQVNSVLGLKPESKLKDILLFMERTYCGPISIQMETCLPHIRKWFFNEMEGLGQNFHLSSEKKKEIFQSLAKTEALEKFLHSRFVGSKRFSIEGGDVLIPMLEYLVTQGIKKDLKEIVIGMAHRGRLNVLNNFMDQATEIVFMEFDGGKALQNFDFYGDVKYHMGYSSVKTLPEGSCNVLLAYNPSHLEAVNPVVSGITRARQRKWADQKERKKVLALMIHGDAAFCGQGSVSETLQMSNLEGFTTGGAIHIILNNQIGFTTEPRDARSSVHASDLAKSIQAPVILVNGDDISSSIKAMDMAFRFRQEFGTDIFIDLICYRRYGHNEGDEPSFTQPVMYQNIKKHLSTMRIYANKLIEEGLLSQESSQSFYEEQMQKLQKILDKTREKSISLSNKKLKGDLWSQYKKVPESDFFKNVDTCPLDKHLEKVLSVLFLEPPNFHLHPKIKKLIQNRRKMVKENRLDWALCELLAYGTLCLENHPVRISGQDSVRGTFSHRHAMYFDTQNNSAYSPLASLNPQNGEFCIYNSPLSEMAVLGFEYGNVCADHSFLTVWEAQFGDFSNGAQIIIDQFISSGEEKWMQACGLTLLLPHGYEGQGPEHSSARLERFLQLCAQGNMQVCYPSTPANFFHLLRRQMKRDFRKPLIVMTPKSLLRHPEVVSSKRELTRSDGFQEVIADPTVKKTKNVKTLILCSGKVFFDLHSERQKNNESSSHIALVRIEQLYPFPALALTPYLNGYHALKKVIWVQEEPANMGATSYMIPQLEKLKNDLGLEDLSLLSLSREEKASPATGSIQIHQKEYEHLMRSVFFHARM